MMMAGTQRGSSKSASMDETLSSARERVSARAAESQLASAMLHRREDHSFAPAAQVSGIKDTELARRLLMRARAIEADSSTFQVHSRDIHKIVARTDESVPGFAKPLVADFRALALHMPACLGEYIHADDVMRFTLGTRLVASDLDGFANMSIAELSGLLSRSSDTKTKRGVAAREARAAKRAKPAEDGDSKEPEGSGDLGDGGDETLAY